jgi:hypothetical protein
MGLFREGKFFSFPTFIAAVFGLGLGASVFLNVAQHTRAQQDAKLMQGTITDLRYQVDQDHKQLAGANSPSPTPSDTPVATPEPSPSDTPAVAGASTTPASSVFKYACNMHTSSSTNASIVKNGNTKYDFSFFESQGLAPLPSKLSGGALQPVTFNGQSGYVQANCLNK